MAKKKTKGVVSGRVAQQRAADARRKADWRKAKKGDQAAIANLVNRNDGVRSNSIWKRLTG